MINFRFLVLGVVSLGLMSASSMVDAQEKPSDPEVGYTQMALADLERYGIFANCENKMVLVDNFVFVPPSDDSANGVIYNACMKSATSSCAVYKDGKQVSIPGDCIDEARKICNFAVNIKLID